MFPNLLIGHRRDFFCLLNPYVVQVHIVINPGRESVDKTLKRIDDSPTYTPIILLLQIVTKTTRQQGTFTNSEDQDEMPHYLAFHKGLHGLLR